VPRHFRYDPRPHRGDHFPRRPVFSASLAPTLSQEIWAIHIFPIVVHVPLDQMGRCKVLSRLLLVAWLSAGFLRFISLTPALSHRLFLVLCRCWTEAWRTRGS
jgi:hypothetical protein